MSRDEGSRSHEGGEQRTIMRIGPRSAGTFAATVGAVVGFVGYALLAVMTPRGSFGAGDLLVWPIFILAYALVAGVGGIVVAWLYNAISSGIGGVTVTVASTGDDQATE